MTEIKIEQFDCYLSDKMSELNDEEDKEDALTSIYNRTAQMILSRIIEIKEN